MSTSQPLRLLVITSRPLVTVEPARQNGQLTFVRRPIALQPVWHVRRELERALKAADGAVAVRYLARATTAAVQSALLDSYDVVHFVGHGAEDGSLLLEQDDATTDALVAERAAQMLRSSQARLVVISACHSGKVAQVLRQSGVANVVAVDAQWPIADRAAALFNQLFYGALVRGQPMSEAFRRGVEAVQIDNEVGDHRLPWDEQTGAELPPWSSRFLPYFSEDRPLAAGETQGGYAELRQWSVPTNLPHTPNIVGREALMAEIIAALGKARMVTLSGPGGIGKTTVSIEVARWHADRELFRDGVFFVPLEGINDAVRLAEALASTFAVTPDTQQPWETVRAALGNRDVLLVLDNAEGLLEAPETDSESAVGALGRLLEVAPGLKVLVTTREALGLRHWEHQLEVTEMDQSEAERLFLRYTPAEQRIGLALAYRVEVRAICRTLDYYPLALVIAAPQLGEAGMTPARLLRDLREAMLTALEDVRSRGVPERLRSLRASLSLSYQRLSGRARVVFFYLGVLPGGASEEGLAVLTGKRFEPAARELVARNLVRWEDSRYTLLAPLRAYAVETRPQKRLTAARLHAAGYYARLARTMNDLLKPLTRRELAERLVEQGLEQSRAEIERGLTLVALHRLDAERTNLVAAVEWAFAGQAWTLVWTLVDNLNTYLHLRAFWGNMVTFGQMAIKAAQQESNRAAVGVALNNLGIVYQVQGRWAEAIAAYEASLTIKRELGDRHGEGQTLNNLGNVYQVQGRWAEAIAAHEASLTIFQELGDRHSEGRTLNNLGSVYQTQGRRAEAIAAYEASLTIYRELGDRHGEGQTLNNLGNVYQVQGRWAEAIAAYEASLTIKRELGDRHGEGQTLNNLGNVYQTQGRWAEAIAAHEASLTIKRELGDRHGEGQTLNNLGIIYEAQGEFNKALHAYQYSLNVLLEMDDSPNTLVVSRSIGWFHYRRGDLDTALEHFARALTLALALHPNPAMETLNQIIALAKEVTASGNIQAVVQLGQKMQEVVEQRDSQGWQDDALQAVGMLCQRVFTVLTLLGALAAVPPKAQREARSQVLEGAREIDALTERRWGLETWIAGLLHQRAGMFARSWRWLTTVVRRQ
jgi:tetratricopeptide (TPR) repeat protein